MKTSTTTSHKRLRGECDDYYVSFVPLNYNTFLNFSKKKLKTFILIRNCRSLIALVVQVVVFSLHSFTFISFVKILIFWGKTNANAEISIIRSSRLVETVSNNRIAMMGVYKKMPDIFSIFYINKVS